MKYYRSRYYEDAENYYSMKSGKYNEAISFAEKMVINSKITYLNANEFNKKLHGLKRYFKTAYKSYVMEVFPKLLEANKKDGKYSIDLPTDALFEKIYGKIQLLFSVKNDVVIIEDLTPSELLLDMNLYNYSIYYGIPYRTSKDLFKIKTMLALGEKKYGKEL